MANTTVQGALSIHGQNPQFLVETVIRNRIWESQYWKEHCFALTAESIIDKAIELKFIGGVYGGNQRPTDFLSLLLKCFKSSQRRRFWWNGYSLTFMDEFVDQLLTEERVCDIILPRLTKRSTLEENGEIGPRQSRLLDALEGKSEHGSVRSRSGSRSRSRSRSPRGSPAMLSSDAGSRYVSRSPSRSISPDRMQTD
ncbi:PRP38 family-domain-containing protein [Mycena haematopus]|nr:PRP38 family-domain-containing protein [Mycena haematopus]